jgi:SOS-response transcriptional repressor LexA
MVFQAIGSHSFRVLVGDPNCLSLIGYGQIILRRRSDLLPEVRKVPIMMRVMPLPLMQGKANKEDKVPTDRSKRGSPEQLLSIKRTFQRSSASNVRSLATMLESAPCGRIRSNMPPPLMLTESHPRRSQGREARMMRSSSSFQPSQVRFLLVVIFG